MRARATEGSRSVVVAVVAACLGMVVAGALTLGALGDSTDAPTRHRFVAESEPGVVIVLDEGGGGYLIAPPGADWSAPTSCAEPVFEATAGPLRRIQPDSQRGLSFVLQQQVSGVAVHVWADSPELGQMTGLSLLVCAQPEHDIWFARDHT